MGALGHYLVLLVLSAIRGHAGDDPHEWLARRPCSFIEWPQGKESSASGLTPARFQESGMAERPLLVRMRVDSDEIAANWSAALHKIAATGRVRSLQAAHSRSEGGLFRYLKKFEKDSTLGEFFKRTTAVKAARDGPSADHLVSEAEYVFMQTDFVSDRLDVLLPMVSSPTFLRESIGQQDMYLLRHVSAFYSVQRKTMLKRMRRIHQCVNTDASTKDWFRPVTSIRYFILGDRGTGLNFHDHGAAWVTAVSGRKHWLVFDPRYFKRMEDEVREFDLPRLRGDFKAGDKMDAERLRRMLIGAADGDVIDDQSPVGFATKGWECVQEPGTTVYVPPGWYHAVTNLDDGIVGYGGQPLGTERRTEQRIKSHRALVDGSARGLMFPKHFANTTEQMEELHGVQSGVAGGKAEL